MIHICEGSFSEALQNGGEVLSYGDSDTSCAVRTKSLQQQHALSHLQEGA